MRIAWTWLCLGGAVAAAILWPRDREETKHADGTAKPAPPAIATPSAIPHLNNPSGRFRREIGKLGGDDSYSYDRFDQLRPLAEQLPKDELLPMLRSVPKDSSAHRLLIYLWAEHDPSAALDDCVEGDWNDDFEVQKLGSFAMSSWARSDPDAATAWLVARYGDLSKTQSSHGTTLRSQYLASLSQSRPEKALAFIRKCRVKHLGGLRGGRFAFQNADHWRELMEIDPVWSRAFAQTDPVGFAEWFADVEDDALREEIDRKRIGGRLNEAEDPIAEADRLWDTRGDLTVAIDVIKQLADLSPALAQDWLRKIAPDLTSQKLDTVKARFLGQISREDPETAFAWLMSIEEESLRHDISAGLFVDWSQFQPETAEREFLAAGWTREWINDRYRTSIYQLR